MDDRKENFLIRASLATQGRSLAFFEEIYPLNQKEKPKIHRLFMEQLKTMLPDDCKTKHTTSWLPIKYLYPLATARSKYEALL